MEGSLGVPGVCAAEGEGPESAGGEDQAEHEEQARSQRTCHGGETSHCPCPSVQQTSVSITLLSPALWNLVVKASASRVEDPWFESRLRWDFFRVDSYLWLRNWNSSGYLPGAWHYRVSTGTGQPGVSILWLGEVERWICNLYLSVAARKIVWADLSLRYTSLLLGC